MEKMDLIKTKDKNKKNITRPNKIDHSIKCLHENIYYYF